MISPIGDDGSEIRRRSDQLFNYVFEVAVSEFGYELIRADKIQRPGIITTQIIDHLLADELVIADLYGRNPNVFYEIGIRHMIEKPIIQIKDPSDIIPFDVNSMRTINVDFRWISSMDKCKEEIKGQIREIENNPDKKFESPVSYAQNVLSIIGQNNPQSEIITGLISQVQILTSQMNQLQNKSKDPYPLSYSGIAGLDDEKKDKEIIRRNLLNELCRRNKVNPLTFGYDLNDVLRTCLGAFAEEYAMQFIKKLEYEESYFTIALISECFSC
ncbi:MAG: hypothetical protein L0H55_16860 [Candidatus Nitrosocosmicus sp.]|nr:hypothetical protein [Candidatus Nitrosocosmicus sp.]